MRSTALFCFHSSGEEVLEEHIGHASAFSVDAHTGQYAWSVGEKTKGLLGGVLWQTATYGGWAANSHWSPSLDPPPASFGATLTSLELRWQPYFDRTDAWLAPLYDNEPGQQQPPHPNDYVTANRNHLLSEMFPCLTLPLGGKGALATDRFGDQVVDMNTEEGFKPNGWPQARTSGDFGSRWLHSDFQMVAYLYTHELFNRIVNITKK